MSIVDAIYDHLTSSSASGNATALVGDRVYFHTASDAAARPYVVYQEITSPSEHDMVGSAQIVNGARWQFTCVADNPEDAFDLGEAVRLDLDGKSDTAFGTANSVNLRTCHLDNRSMQDFGPNAGERERVHARLMDFLMSYTETVPTL